MTNHTECPNCYGKGKTIETVRWSDGLGQIERDCPICKGEGTVPIRPIDLTALSTVQITLRRDNLLAVAKTADDAHRAELTESADRMTAELERRAAL